MRRIGHLVGVDADEAGRTRASAVQVVGRHAGAVAAERLAQQRREEARERAASGRPASRSAATGSRAGHAARLADRLVAHASGSPCS